MVLVCWAFLSVGATTSSSAAPLLSHKLVLPSSHVEHEDASFYVFKDDIVLFPISYSIPKERVLLAVPNKTAFAINDSTRSFQYKNYQFGPLQEDEYHENLQKHRFGDTRRKGGFDCLRHYELLANGCVPILRELELLPKSILTTLPRDLLKQAKDVFSLPWEGTQDGPGKCQAADAGAYDALASKLLEHTATKLTTEATARYILDTLDINLETARVLYLPCTTLDNFPSYLTASVFHGLVSLLGDRVLDVPEYDYAYQFDHPPQNEALREEEARLRSQIWGQGYTLGFKLRRRPHLFRGNISERIKNMEFDLIVFARMSPYEPCNFWSNFGSAGAVAPEYFTDVLRTYPRERVALLYGDDSGLEDAVVRTQLSRFGAMNRGLGMVFMREMLPFVSEGPSSEALRPVDGRLLQPGCFYEEWLGFFGRWRTPHCVATQDCLLACAAWGHCESAKMEDFGPPQKPPEDWAVLRQFCRTGFTFRAALLVQKLGPDACMDDEACKYFCQFSLNVFSSGFAEVLPTTFFKEFGLTPQQLTFVLSQGCSSSNVALQSHYHQDK